MKKIKVILVDDHELVRMGFRLLLEGANNLEVIAEFSSGEEVVNEFLNYEFDLIVIDISMPGIGGIEAIKRILLKKPKTKILVLSAHEDDLHANRVLKAGAKGYLTKRSAPSELVEAINKVISGETFLELEIAKSIASAKSCLRSCALPSIIFLRKLVWIFSVRILLIFESS